MIIAAFSEPTTGEQRHVAAKPEISSERDYSAQQTIDMSFIEEKNDSAPLPVGGYPKSFLDKSYKEMPEENYPDKLPPPENDFQNNTQHSEGGLSCKRENIRANVRNPKLIRTAEATNLQQHRIK